MKLNLICAECTKEWFVNPLALVDEDKAIAKVSIITPLQNSTVYECVCRQGHSTTVVLQNTKFELLFDAGIYALKDGYYREAVSSFSVALERFYEYSIRVLLSSSIDQIGKTNFSDTWKAISKQSERQIGAFYMLFLCTIKHQAPVFNSAFLKANSIHLGLEGNDPVSFRNKVIHEGYVPSYKQALSFGEAVNLYIRALIKEFNKGLLDIIAPTIEDYSEAQSLVRAKALVGSLMVLPTFMSIIDVEHIRDGRSLIDYMQNSKISHL